MKFYDHYRNRFFPLTLTRKTADLILGTNTLGEKWKRTKLPVEQGQQLWINPVVIPDDHIIKAINRLPVNTHLRYNEHLIATRIESSKTSHPLSPVPPSQLSSRQLKSQPRLIRYLQDLLDYNAGAINSDIEKMATANGDYSSSYAEENTFIHRSAKVGKIIIDTSDGPVFVGPNAIVMNGSILKGPLAILDNAVVKMGAKIYPGTTIGPYSAVGGEIKKSIIHSYTNKTHDGYLGDSIIGSWNNLGANTNVSNVSNNFDFIKTKDWESGKDIKLSTIKRGVIAGDFVKTAINSTIYSGTLIGPFCSIATSIPIKGKIPPASWITNEKNHLYNPEKLRIHCQNQMRLKNQEWSREWEEYLQEIIGQKSKQGEND